MKKFAFSKSARLLKARDFDRVFRHKCVSADDTLVLHAAGGTASQTRLGLVVTRKNGSAVVRNRWKRALREAFRLEQHNLPAPLDIVVRPKTEATINVAQLRDSLLRLSRRASIKLQRASKED